MAEPNILNGRVYAIFDKGSGLYYTGSRSWGKFPRVYSKPGPAKSSMNSAKYHYHVRDRIQDIVIVTAEIGNWQIAP